MNFLISFGICSTPKLSKYVTFSIYIQNYLISSFWPALTVASRALINPRPLNALLNTLAANVPNNIGRNRRFYFLALFLIVLLTPFISKPDPKMVFWITAPVAEAAAVNPNGVKTLLGNSISTVFINGKPAVING